MLMLRLENGIWGDFGKGLKVVGFCNGGELGVDVEESKMFCFKLFIWDGVSFLFVMVYCVNSVFFIKLFLDCDWVFSLDDFCLVNNFWGIVFEEGVLVLLIMFIFFEEFKVCVFFLVLWGFWFMWFCWIFFIIDVGIKDLFGMYGLLDWEDVDFEYIGIELCFLEVFFLEVCFLSGFFVDCCIVWCGILLGSGCVLKEGVFWCGISCKLLLWNLRGGLFLCCVCVVWREDDFFSNGDVKKFCGEVIKIIVINYYLDLVFLVYRVFSEKDSCF